MIRRHVYYRGQVQGVGFRYTTVRVAGNYAVTGFVGNRADGTVEVVAEGERATVDAFLENLGEAMSGYIRETKVVDEPYQGEFVGFNVRF